MKVKQFAFVALAVLSSLVSAGLKAEIVSLDVGNASVDPSSIVLKPLSLGRVSARPAAANMDTTDNWCGALKKASPDDTVFSVSAEFTVPKLRFRPDTPTSQFAASWVGIDSSCPSGFVQAGTVTQINADGSQSAYVWFEWLPDDSVGVENWDVSPGEVVSISITAVDDRNVTITVNNISRGGTVVTITLSNKDRALCLTEAEWVVEDFSVNDDPTVPFAGFEDVFFENMQMQTWKAGITDGMEGAGLITMEQQDSGVLCTPFAIKSNMMKLTS